MRAYLLVAAGGSVGALLRWGTNELIPHGPGEFPWSTLLVNITGCLVIGFAARSFRRRPELWLVAITGLLGGFTTFSTFAVETNSLIDAGRGGAALTYIGVSVVAGLAATEIARGDWSGR